MSKILLMSAQKPDNTGSGVFLKELAAAFRAAGHAVAVVAGVAAEDEFAFPDDTRWRPVRFQTQELPFPVVGMSDEMPYRATRYRDLTPDMLERFYAAFDAALDEVLAQFQPDVIFSNHLYVLTAHVAGRDLGIPIVGMCHGSEIRQIRKNPLERATIRAGVGKLSAIMALHGVQKADIIAEYGVPAALVHVTGTGYNSAVFHTKAATTLLSRESRGRTIVFAGKITGAKGVSSLVRAADSLIAPEAVELTLAGGYSTKAEYDAIVEQAQSSCCSVRFPGRLTQWQLADAYRAADVFALPSFYEGLPLVVIEALACGCKVVVTDLPGIRPWLEANVPDAPVWFVEPPAMRNVDEPQPDALPAFEKRLADALADALETPCVACDVTGLSWDALARRALELALPRS
ncbi:MAG: glycosyltransferase [Coriobacteriia bacterium]|nr:glycosyltransferase [Coriobacteriia bacterium]